MGKIVDEIFNKLKLFTNISTDENKLKFDIEVLVQESLNYMNRKDFPQELELTIVKYINEKISKKENANLKSVSVGDTKLEYSEINPEKALLDLKEQLNKFRKVGTV